MKKKRHLSIKNIIILFPVGYEGYFWLLGYIMPGLSFYFNNYRFFFVLLVLYQPMMPALLINI